MDSWQHDDIPIGKFNVLTEPNPVTGEIKQITDIAGKITEEIIQTKSEQIRNALIDLGWLPPDSDPLHSVRYTYRKWMESAQGNFDKNLFIAMIKQVLEDEK